MKKVFIVNSSRDYDTMFERLGYGPALMDDMPDLICFTGGEDVDPRLYGEAIHPTTHFNIKRDAEERLVYEKALKLGIPMVGICRGAQFLHVMNHGRLYQDVNNHALWGCHEATDIDTGDVVLVTSTHHQQMRNTHKAGGEIVCIAHESSHKSYMQDGEEVVTLTDMDIEVMWHGKTQCLCFQPHPEFVGADSTYLYFKNLLARYLGE